MNVAAISTGLNLLRKLARAGSGQNALALQGRLLFAIFNMVILSAGFSVAALARHSFFKLLATDQQGPRMAPVRLISA